MIKDSRKGRLRHHVRNYNISGCHNKPLNLGSADRRYGKKIIWNKDHQFIYVSDCTWFILLSLLVPRKSLVSAWWINEGIKLCSKQWGTWPNMTNRVCVSTVRAKRTTVLGLVNIFLFITLVHRLQLWNCEQRCAQDS